MENADIAKIFNEISDLLEIKNENLFRVRSYRNAAMVIGSLPESLRSIVERDEKFGGNLEFERYEDLEKMYANKELHPLDLKNALAKEVNNLLSIIRKNRKELEKLSKKAY